MDKPVMSRPIKREKRKQTHGRRKQPTRLNCIPLSAYSDISENVLTYMFNKSGKIRDFMAIVAVMPKQGVEVRVSISGVLHSASYTLKIFKAGKLYTLDESLEVHKGDILKASIIAIGDEEISGISFSCMYEIKPEYKMELVDEGISTGDINTIGAEEE